MLDCLIRYGADINFQNAHGDTALLLALDGQRHVCVEKLIESGADVDIISKKDGDFALVTGLKLATTTKMLHAATKKKKQKSEWWYGAQKFN